MAKYNFGVSTGRCGLPGTYHAFKFGKCAPRYLGEFQYRFNRRYERPDVPPRLATTAHTTTAWPKWQLRLADFGSNKERICW